jgi:hypothetical protein
VYKKHWSQWLLGYSLRESFVQNDGRGDNQTCATHATTGNGSRINFCKFKNQDGAESVTIAGFAHSPFALFFESFAEYQIFWGHEDFSGVRGALGRRDWLSG